MADSPRSNSRLGSQRVGVWAVLAVCVLSAFALFVGRGMGRAEAADGPVDAARGEHQWVEVRRGPLHRDHDFHGDVDFGETRPLVARRDGVVTWVPEVDTIIEPGQVLWRIDDEPTILAPGAIPSYRRLSTRSDDGADIRQLEEFLIAWGYGPGNWEADDEFTSTTESAVEDFQADHGLDDTGVLEAGSIVFADSAVRVANRVSTGVTASAGPIVSVTEVEARVVVVVASEQVELLNTAASISVELADGTEGAATLDDVKPLARDAEGTMRYQAEFLIAPGLSGGDGPVEPQPATLLVSQLISPDTLLVPADAVMALAGGDYGVEVLTDDPEAVPELVIIEVITSVDETVAVDGEIQAGDRVVVP